MANRYANLIGSKKISEDFGNINIGFDRVQTDVDVINAELTDQDTRIDNLVINGDSGPEAADARYSAPKNITFPVLKDRLDADEEDLVAAKGRIARYENIWNNKPTVHAIAHRGFSGIAPENTLPALQLAIEHGFKFVEYDILPTSDGEFVVIHDDTVDRTTDGTGTVSSMTLAQIKALDAGSWFNQRYAGTRIPTMDEWLYMCKAGRIIPYTELKTEFNMGQLQIIVDKIKKYTADEYGGIVTAFSVTNLQNIRTFNQTIPLGLYCNASNANVDIVRDLGNAIIIPEWTTINESFVQYAHSQEVRVECFTANQVKDIKSLISIGVQGYMSDKILFSGGY